MRDIRPAMAFGLGSPARGRAWLSHVLIIMSLETDFVRRVIADYDTAGVEEPAFLAALARLGVKLMDGEPANMGYLDFGAFQPPCCSRAEWQEAFRRADLDLARAVMNLPPLPSML